MNLSNEENGSRFFAFPIEVDQDEVMTEAIDQTPNAPVRVAEAWERYQTETGDSRSVAELVEVSVFVSTNHVYRMVFDDATTVIAKVSSYGSFFLFSEDHDRLHATHRLLAGTRHERLLADVLTVDDRPFTDYDGQTWVVFYEEVPRGRGHFQKCWLSPRSSTWHKRSLCSIEHALMWLHEFR